MKKFFWFGDSWLEGSELELTLPRHQISDYVFPTLVSQHFNALCKNYGESGSGPDIIPYHFSKIAHTVNPGDLVFFCLSAPHRVTFFNDCGNHQQVIPGPNYNKNVSPYVKEWFKYFDTEAQRIYTYDRTINLLYLWAKELGARAYFCNLFTTVNESMLDIVPASSWLIPKNRCLAQFILSSIDNNQGIVISDDMPTLTNAEWAIHKELLEKYVKPGYCHPNVEGHKKIADEIIKILENE